MDQTTIDVRPRALLGKKARFLRRAGITPANLYGAGMESLALQVDAKDLVRTIATTSRNTAVELKVHGESKPRTAFIWRLQRHPMTEDILHVDFYHVDVTRTMRAKVPIALEGVDPELDKFAKRVTQYLQEVDVESLPLDLPAQIALDVSALQEIDDDKKVADLVVSDKVTILTDPEELVARVTAIVEAVEDVEAAAALAGEAAEEGAEAAPGEAADEAAEGSDG